MAYNIPHGGRNNQTPKDAVEMTDERTEQVEGKEAQLTKFFTVSEAM